MYLLGWVADSYIIYRKDDTSRLDGTPVQDASFPKKEKVLLGMMLLLGRVLLFDRMLRFFKHATSRVDATCSQDATSELDKLLGHLICHFWVH